MKNALRFCGLALLLGATVTACSDDEETPDGGSTGGAVVVVDAVQRLTETNADIAFAAYSDSVATAEALKAALTAFENDPTQGNFDAAKIAWLVAREPYGQTEVYRFRLSPIDSTNYADEDGPEGDINAWPLGEALIDYVVEGNDFGPEQLAVTEHSTGVDYPDENIINSMVTIDEALISNTATAEDEHDVIAGYHALEFMLWGQDVNMDGSADTFPDGRELSSPGNILTSGGHRPLTDFTGADGEEQRLSQRRFLYMNVVVDKLIADLTAVRDSWAPGASYRTEFTTVTDEATARQRLSEILTGMGTLSEGELGGERMQISLSSNSQEDEHSCFSDNTHRDIFLNAEGVRNSFLGEYAGYDSTLDGSDDATTRAVSGYGVDDYLAEVGLTDEAESLRAALELTATNAGSIDSLARAGTPVDVQITDANGDNAAPMRDTILSLNAQSGVIAGLATTLGLDADAVVDPEASECDTTDPTTEC